jgi:hypothetical protein
VAIPKIPGLSRKEYKNNISKELDLVIEKDELEISPKKNTITSFADEHTKNEAMGLTEPTPLM